MVYLPLHSPRAPITHKLAELTSGKESAVHQNVSHTHKQIQVTRLGGFPMTSILSARTSATTMTLRSIYISYTQ
jgi:hypothetical protein